jgi:predicted nuclease of predicted toxin-antitoxin system
MKLLLDENLPKRLKLDFPDHEIYTVFEKGWAGKKDGEIIVLLNAENFDAFLTFDRNLQYQQNFLKFTVPVLILHASDNTYLTLKEYVPTIKIALNNKLNPGPKIIQQIKNE